MEIRVDDLKGQEIAALLDTHLRIAAEHTPPQSVHALDLDALSAPDITFWTAWDCETLLGCGALKVLGSVHGEIKSMHTAEVSRSTGVASSILEMIIKTANHRGYNRLSLETGSTQAFGPARALYRKYGFVKCGPFGDYRPDRNSEFMRLDLPQ